MNYEKIVKELEAKDPYAIAKLSIYNELRWWFAEYDTHGIAIEDAVDFVTDLYLRSKTEMVAAAVALRVIDICDDPRELLDADFEEFRRELER